MTEGEGREYVLIILADKVEIAVHQMTESRFIKDSVVGLKLTRVKKKDLTTDSFRSRHV